MGLRTVVFLLSVAVAASVDPKPCCYPDQFVISSSTLFGSSRRSEFITNIVRQLAYDVPNNRQAELYFEFREPGEMTSRIIYDYAAQKRYSIYKERSCRVSRIRGEINHCVSAQATFQESVYLGDKKLTVDTFGFKFNPHPRFSGYLSQTVTSDGDCLPISGTFEGTSRGFPQVSHTKFSNYEAGIQNPSKFFDVPDFCPESYSEEPPMDDFLFPGNIFFETAMMSEM